MSTAKGCDPEHSGTSRPEPRANHPFGEPGQHRQEHRLTGGPACGEKIPTNSRAGRTTSARKTLAQAPAPSSGAICRPRRTQHSITAKALYRQRGHQREATISKADSTHVAQAVAFSRGCRERAIQHEQDEDESTEPRKSPRWSKPKLRLQRYMKSRRADGTGGDQRGENVTLTITSRKDVAAGEAAGQPIEIMKFKFTAC